MMMMTDCTFRQNLNSLWRDDSGTALTEMAFITPVLLTLGVYGLETAMLAITHMKIGQAAIHIADDASRIGAASGLEEEKIYESDIVDLLLGSDLQAGGGIDLYEHGRVIISSQEVDPDDSSGNQQYIHWQRCMGKRKYDSQYGGEGTGKGDINFAGMGPPGEEVLAMDGDAVIFVEISYEYQPLMTDAFVGDREIVVSSSFTVRDDRDLSGIYSNGAGSSTQPATCDRYGRFRSGDPSKGVKGGWEWEWED